MPTAFEIAHTLLNRGEIPDRAAIQSYLRTGGAGLDPATTAWCAAFVNSSLQQAGQKGTGSNLARSFLNYGTAVDQPQPGDIAVFSRGDPKGPYGHVGFFNGYGSDGKIQVLGGNQGDAVSVASYDPSKLLGFRHVGGAGPIQDAGTPQTPAGVEGVQQPMGLAANFVDPSAMTEQPSLGGVIASAFSTVQGGQEKQAKAEAERRRKQALFGNGLADMYA